MKKAEDEYLYWDKVKYLVGEENRNLFWQAVKLKRSMNRKHLQFGDYNFSFTITDKMQELLHKFDLNFGGNLGTKDLIPDHNKQFFLVNSIMEEAIASSQMEGASTTRKVAKEMLRKQIKPRDKSQQMILNNYETIKFITEHKDEQLTKEFLLQIHALISSKTLDDKNDEGRIRTDDNIFVMNGTNGEVAHIPPSYSELPEMLDTLFSFANSEDKNFFIHPIIKAIIIHFIISYMHPFVDGNGRTARALVYWFLLKNGYWLTEYLSISRIIYKSKAQYEKAFLYTEHDEFDLGYFLQYNLLVMQKSYEELKKYLQQKLDEQSNITLFSTIKGINTRQAEVLRMVSEKPKLVLISNEFESLFGVTARTARNDLAELVEMGYLQKIQINMRLIGYVRSDDFEQRLKLAEISGN